MLNSKALSKSWYDLLKDEFQKDYMVVLYDFLIEKEENATIYPPKELIFNAFSYVPFEEVKIVIIGQDPYHGKGQSHGLAFSVLPGVPIPPSLRNIYRELSDDLNIDKPKNGCLEQVAKQGVLLLNTVLTVEEKKPGSHQNRGWELFTDRVVQLLLSRKDPLVFMLWGNPAKEKLSKVIENQKHPHLILTASHPSFFSANKGFFGCRHFSKANSFLEKNHKEPIDWEIQ